MCGGEVVVIMRVGGGGGVEEVGDGVGGSEVDKDTLSWPVWKQETGVNFEIQQKS